PSSGTGAEAQAPAATASAHKATKGSAKEGTATAKTSPDAKSEGSYNIGVSLGERLLSSGLTNGAVAVDRLAQGLRDGLSGKAKMDQGRLETINTMIRAAAASAAETNHAAAKGFLAQNAKKKDVVTTASGLQYKVLSEGSGASPQKTDLVTVNYRG